MAPTRIGYHTFHTSLSYQEVRHRSQTERLTGGLEMHQYRSRSEWELLILARPTRYRGRY